MASVIDGVGGGGGGGGRWQEPYLTHQQQEHYRLIQSRKVFIRALELQGGDSPEVDVGAADVKLSAVGARVANDELLAVSEEAGGEELAAVGAGGFVVLALCL